MDLNYLRRLVKIFDESTMTDLRIEEEGIKLRISKVSESQSSSEYQPHFVQMAPSVSAPTLPTNATPTPSVTSEPQKNDEKATASAITSTLHTVLSPIVGTFYRAPAPDADPFVQVGSHISIGSALCLVEAMKLMNEIESDISGIVVKALVENGQPVEYGQPLFQIQPD